MMAEPGYAFEDLVAPQKVEEGFAFEDLVQQPRAKTPTYSGDPIAPSGGSGAPGTGRRPGQPVMSPREFWTGSKDIPAPWEKEGSIGASVKRIGRGTAGNLATLGDMAGSIPAGVGSTLADMLTRLGEMPKGLSKEEYEKRVAAARDGVMSSLSFDAFTKGLNALTGEEKASQVESLIQAAMGGVETKAKQIEGKTGGAVSAESVKSLVNELLGLGGAKGGAAMVKGGVKKMQTAHEAVMNLPDLAAGNPELKSALAKVNDGRGFEMTQGERQAFYDGAEAVRGTSSPGPMGRQRGAVDWNAVTEDTPIGPLLDKLPNTLKTLERLPKGRFEFTKEQLLQVLNQADIAKPEKDILGPIVDSVATGTKISAKDLIQQARGRMGQFDLEPVRSEEFANYGLENIRDIEYAQTDPGEAGGYSAREGDLPPAQTTLYRSPSIRVDPDSNHFGDDRLFGWTRSFEEGGVKHVVEIQSDLAQKVGKTLSPEEAIKAENELKDWTREKNIIAGRTTLTSNWEKAIRGMWEQLPEAAKARLQEKLGMTIEEVLQPGDAKTVKGPWPGQRLDARSALDQLLHARTIDLDVLIRENKVRLSEGQAVKAISPMLPAKNWTKRLVREELARAIKANSEYDEINPHLQGKYSKPVIRFASPDTVAKVEGWPDRENQLVDQIERLERERAGAGQFNRYAISRRIAELKADLTTARDVLSPPRFSPEHQSIYDRYRDIDKFLKSLGGKPYTDPHGHTWTEVSLTREMRRPSQFGGIDQEMLKRMGITGAGAAMGAWLGGDEKRGTGAVMGAAVGLLGARGGVGKSIAKGADYGLGVLSTRIKNLSEPLVRRARDYERLTRERTHQDITAVDPFLRRLHNLDPKVGLSSPRQAAMETALKTGDAHQIRAAIQASGDAELQSAWPAVERAVRKVEVDLLSAGLLDLQKVQYFPVLRDAKGVPAPPAEALHTFLSTAHRTLEKARFFGQDLKLKGTEIDTGESIRALAKREQRAGRITPEGAEELRSMLYSRFGSGEIAANPMVQGLKNWAYAGLLGNPVSAIANLGDLLTTAGKQGMRPAIEAVARRLTGQEKVAIKDFGLVDLNMEEFFNTPQSAKWLNRVMKVSGFHALDTLGKDVLLGAALSKLSRQAKSSPGKILDKYEKMYGSADTLQLIRDLKAGRQTDLVRSTLFSELSDVQPISKFEVPQGYLDMPNGKIIYMLKTFALKQVDIIRHEAYNNIRDGFKSRSPAQVAKGIAHLGKWALVFGLAGMSTSALQDWILGRKVKMDGDAFTENLFRTFGWTNFVTDQVKQGKVKDAIGNMVLPPFDMFAQTLSLNPKAVQYIPLGGKIFYNREMGGAEKADKAAEKADRKRNKVKGKAPPL